MHSYGIREAPFQPHMRALGFRGYHFFESGQIRIIYTYDTYAPVVPQM